MVSVSVKPVYDTFAFGHSCFVFFSLAEKCRDQCARPELILGKFQANKLFFDRS